MKRTFSLVAFCLLLVFKGWTQGSLNSIVDLEKPDTVGALFKLSSLRGKYVLIDFWGSWCHACRLGHPHLREVYRQYHEKGLELVGVSTEAKTTPVYHDKWVTAIRQDSLPGYQLFNAITEAGDIVASWSIKVFPTKILLDPEGRIIFRTRDDDEEAKELDQKLAEIFGDPKKKSGK